MSDNDRDSYNENLQVIKNQIKQIGNLVNEFSDFARMPKPILKDNNIISLFKDNIKLLNNLDESILIDLKPSFTYSKASLHKSSVNVFESEK